MASLGDLAGTCVVVVEFVVFVEQNPARCVGQECGSYENHPEQLRRKFKKFVENLKTLNHVSFKKKLHQIMSISLGATMLKTDTHIFTDKGRYFKLMTPLFLRRGLKKQKIIDWKTEFVHENTK